MFSYEYNKIYLEILTFYKVNNKMSFSYLNVKPATFPQE